MNLNRTRNLLAVAALFVFALMSIGAVEKPINNDSPPKTENKKLSAVEIMNKFDDLWRGESSKARMTMMIKTANWERTLSMEAWSKGKEQSLVKVLKPLKERGTATLKVGNEIYNYLPKTDRTIKLTAAMMMGAWMGSHFTNDDLVKESRMSEDCTLSITFEGKRDGADIIEITCIPKPDAAVVWGKVVSIVRANDYQPLKVLYYDEDLELSRTMTLTNHKLLGGRLMPTKMRMVPTDKPDEFTEFTYDDIEFDLKLKDSFFSLKQLRR